MLLIACLAVAVGNGCGARTALRGGQPCGDQGAELECATTCGAGVTTCEGGYWTECAVEKTTERCSNECGEGERTCENDEWSECVVPVAERACTNDCGEGRQTCSDDTWSICEVAPVERACSNKCGTGTERCENDTWSACTAPQPLPPTFAAIVRDFSDAHPDFETGLAAEEDGIVDEMLGPDDKPVFRGGTTVTTAANFDQWWRDVPGVNESTVVELPLTVSAQDPRLYVFDNPDFFPIDGRLLGNEGRAHNYHFTLEASGTFVYQGGEIFGFTGDDDLWVFVNRRLVIDLGGLHSSLSDSVRLDDVASEIGLVIGGEYSLHLFFAERQTVASNFSIETSIAGLGECPPGAP